MDDREDRDVLPPEGWQPKSAFFKRIWKGAEFRLNNPRVTIICPRCHEKIVLQVTPLPSPTETS